MGLEECISMRTIRKGTYWIYEIVIYGIFCQSVWKRIWRNMRHNLFGYSLSKFLRSIRFLGISTPLSNITLFPKCLTSCFKIYHQDAIHWYFMHLNRVFGNVRWSYQTIRHLTNYGNIIHTKTVFIYEFYYVPQCPSNHL